MRSRCSVETVKEGPCRNFKIKAQGDESNWRTFDQTAAQTNIMLMNILATSSRWIDRFLSFILYV